MKAEEYQDLIDDPTGFFLNVYFPRISSQLKPFETIPLLPPVHEIPLVPPAVRPFGAADMQSALKSLTHAGEETLKWAEAVARLNASIMVRSAEMARFTDGSLKRPATAS